MLFTVLNTANNKQQDWTGYLLSKQLSQLLVYSNYYVIIVKTNGEHFLVWWKKFLRFLEVFYEDKAVPAVFIFSDIPTNFQFLD